MLVAGDWTDGSEAIPVINPYDNSEIDTVPRATATTASAATLIASSTPTASPAVSKPSTAPLPTNTSVTSNSEENHRFHLNPYHHFAGPNRASVSVCEAALRLREGALSRLGQEQGTARPLVRLGQSAHCRALCHSLSGTTQEQCVHSGDKPLKRGHNYCQELKISTISMQISLPNPPQSPPSANIILPLPLLRSYSGLP